MTQEQIIKFFDTASKDDLKIIYANYRLCDCEEGEEMKENLICQHCLQLSMEYVCKALARGIRLRVYYCENCKKGVEIKED